MKRFYFLPFFFFVVAYLLPLGIRPMLDPDEYRYAEIPREMLRSGDWVSPTLGQMPYFEKPVLGYQLTAVSFRIFGENAFGLRFPAALAALLTAVLIALFLYRYTRDHRIASLGALLYLSFGLVYAVGTTAVLDSQLTFFVTGSLAAFLPACLKKHWSREKIVLLLLAGAAAGCAFLVKGFLAFVVPVIVAVPFLIWEKRWRDFYRLPWLPLAAAALVALPWSLMIHRQSPDFWRYFIVVEHWQRFTGGEEQHLSGWWAMIPPLFLGLLPGGLLGICVFPGLRGRWREFLSRSHVRYALCWVLFPFLFFSASSGKLPTYILPCFAPLAVLGALGISTYFRCGGAYRTFGVTMDILGFALLLAGPVAAAAWLAVPVIWPSLPEAYWYPTSLAMPGALAALFCGAALIGCRHRSWRSRYIVFFCGLAVVIAAGHLALRPMYLGGKTPGPALAAWRAEIPENAAVVCGNLPHAAMWCWERPDVLLCRSRGEFDYGLATPAGEGRYLEERDLEALVRAGEVPLAVIGVNDTHFTRFCEKKLPPPTRLERKAQVELRLYLPAAASERE